MPDTALMTRNWRLESLEAILLYSQIDALSSHYERGNPQQQMGEDAETHNQT